MTLVNELIGSSIARLVGVPAPVSVLIDVEPAFLAVAGLPSLSAGLHFGSKFVADVVGPARSLISQVSNTSQFAHVIASDAVTNNHDRNNDGNFLVRVASDNPRRLEFVAIDFGHCFGNQWDEGIANMTGWCGNMIPEMAPFIVGEAPFAQASALCSKTEKTTVAEIVQAIPPAWNLTTLKSVAIEGYLFNRLQTVDTLLESHRSKFPGWTKKGITKP